MRTTYVVIALLLAFFQATAHGYTPKLVEHDCWNVSFYTTSNARCGYVIVPENRQQPEGRQVKIAVAVVPAQGKRLSDIPLVWLEGGPGGSPHAGITRETQFLPAGYDWILPDIRGSGFSEPLLDCPEEKTVPSQYTLNEPYVSELAPQLAALKTCATRLATFADLTQYNTHVLAEDLDDIRRALRIKRWHLISGSYGGTLALHFAERFPQYIVSSTLYWPYPVQYGDNIQTFLTSGDAILNYVFTACRWNTQCFQAFPDVDTKYRAVLARLDAQPLRVSGNSNNDLILNGGDFNWWIISTLIGGGRASDVPFLIYQAHQADYRELIEARQPDSETDEEEQGPAYGRGANISIQCADRDRWTEKGNAQQTLLARFPRVKTRLREDGQDYCQVWSFAQLPESHWAAPVSKVPTLIFSGRDDVSVPIEGARDLARTLPNSQLVEFDWFAHGDSNDCTLAITQTFLKAPMNAVDQRCVYRDPDPEWRLSY
jgi:pimeloyl-ACP methyl ester carboxylesterase